MGSKGGETTSQTQHQQWGPNNWVKKKYSALLEKVFNLGKTPYEGYEGERVAGFTPDQLKAMQGVRNAQGIATPYYNRAENLINKSAVPVYQTYENYMNPYTQNVVDATQRQFAANNAEQQSQIQGNAIAKGAMGGDRVGVAQGEAVRQQALAQDPMIAQLYSEGYDKSIAAAQADAARYGQAGQQMMGLGSQAQNSAYIDASQLMGSGNTQQQQNQAGLNVDYQNFLEERGYPYQQAQWMAGILGSLGPQMGGTSKGASQTTQPGPDPWSTVAGLGMTALGALSGNPMMMAGGISSAAGGASPSGAQQSPQSFSPWARSGLYSDGGAVHRRAGGGGVSLPYGEEGMQDSGIPTVDLPLSQLKPPDAMKGPSSGSSSSTTSSTGDMVNTAMKLAKVVGMGMARGGGINIPHFESGGEVDDSDYGSDDGFLPAYMPPEAGGGVLPMPMPIVPPTPRAMPQSSGLGVGSSFPAFAPAPASAAAPAGGGILGGLPKELGPALMAAGFATMASKAHHVGQAIGEGGLQGMTTFNTMKEQGRKSEETKAKAALDAQKLGISAKDAAARLAETSRHNRASEGVAYENLKRGNYDLIPGTGKDESGETVPGTYKLDKKTGNSTFQPGVSVTRKGDADIDAKLKSAETRTGMTVEGANLRNERTVAGAGDRNAATIAGAETRTQAQIDAANARNAANIGSREGMSAAQIAAQNQRNADNNTARAARAPAGGPGGGVSKWKYDAWLGSHPGDTDGALDYASGRRKMGDADINKAAIGLAAKEANDAGYEGDDRKKFIQKRTREYGDIIRAERPMEQPGAQPAKKPTASAAPPPAPNSALKKPSAEQVAAAQAAIQTKGRDAVMRMMQDRGYDTSGL